MRIILIFFFIMLIFFAKAQKIENIQAIQDGKQILITYDIIGAKEWQKFEVSMYYSSDAYNWKLVNMGISGDIGNEIAGGTGKQITWDVLKQVERLVGSNYMFKVKAIVTGDISKQNYTETTSNLNIDMVLVKGGTFTMGCTSEQSDCEEDEKPAHSVTLSDYYIGKFEVTQKQWTAIMGNNPSYFKDCGNCPVETVSYNEIQDFLQKLNQKTGKKYSLPTEAQWEYAARGGSKSKGFKFSGSNTVGDVTDNSGNKTHLVGQKQANELGIYDMSGNVWEWCSDWYDKDYYKHSPQNNPENTNNDSPRVLRGGSWLSNGSYCRGAYRYYDFPGSRYYYFGFRLVLVPD